MQVYIVYPQIEAASDVDAGRVTEGFFVIENGDAVVMTSEHGTAVRDSDGKRIEQKLAPGESAHKIASRLTLKIFYARRDDTGDFNRPTESLRYAQSGCFEAIRGSPVILWRLFAITVVGSKSFRTWRSEPLFFRNRFVDLLDHSLNLDKDGSRSRRIAVGPRKFLCYLAARLDHLFTSILQSLNVVRHRRSLC